MREVIESESFQRAVEKLGGARAIDRSLEPIIEGLYQNPYGFHVFENDWTKFRYARVKGVEFTPPLVVTFTIDSNGDVTLTHVEEDLDAI